MSWTDALDAGRALKNLEQEMTGDWFRDPWGWPEYDFLRTPDGAALLNSRIRGNSLVSEPAAIEVPKENFGIRPAVILSVGDRVMYQMMADAVSKAAIGDLLPDVYGWRLPIDASAPGRYARQDYQWLEYRSKLSTMADEFDFGLKTDVSSFFASLDPEKVAERLTRTAAEPTHVEKLSRMLMAWKIHNPRPGLPQRSTASAVLANMMLRDLDSALQEISTKVRRLGLRAGERHSFARWMDDIWVFSNDDADLRAGQVEIQRVLSRVGLTLNSAKTKLLSDNELAEASKKIQSSAIDSALEGLKHDSKPLESLVDAVLEDREASDRSVVRFVSSRMRDHRILYRVSDLVRVSVRMPHAADHLSRLFRKFVPQGEMQDWFSDYVGSTWNQFEWATAQYATAITPRKVPRRATRSLFSEFLSAPNASLPLLAVAAQRLSVWDARLALEIIEDRVASEVSSQNCRVLSLAALQAGAPGKLVRRWLSQHDENYLTMLMLESRGFSAPQTVRDYQ